MLDEFIFVPKTVFVKNLVVIYHDRVIDTATEGEIHRPQLLDVTHETKRACATDFLHERGAGKIHGGGLGTSFEHRVIKVDAKADLEALERQESRFLVAVFHGYFPLDTNKAFGRFLFRDPCRLQQKHEGAGTAVHDRHLRGTELDETIVDTQSRHGGKKMLYCCNADAILDQSCRQHGFAHVFRDRKKDSRRGYVKHKGKES